MTSNTSNQWNAKHPQLPVGSLVSNDFLLNYINKFEIKILCIEIDGKIHKINKLSDPVVVDDVDFVVCETNNYISIISMGRRGKKYTHVILTPEIDN